MKDTPQDTPSILITSSAEPQIPPILHQELKRLVVRTQLTVMPQSPPPRASSSAPTSSPSLSQSCPNLLFQPQQHLDPLGQPQGRVLPPPISVSDVQQQPQPLNQGQKQEQYPKQQAQPALPAQADTKDQLRSRPGQGDFCLIAEAAKRAQIEVLMRDMSEIAL